MLRETISIRTGVLLVCSVLPVYAQEPATPAAANVGGAATVTGSGTPNSFRFGAPPPVWATQAYFRRGRVLALAQRRPAHSSTSELWRSTRPSLRSGPALPQGPIRMPEPVSPPREATLTLTAACQLEAPEW